MKSSIKYPFFYAAICLLLLATNSRGQQLETIQVGSTTRSMLVHVPSNLPQGSPLLLSLHGLNQDVYYQQGQTQWESVANANGFIVVYPAGINNSWDLYGTRDVDFILAIIDNMNSRFGIDRNRVYLSGFSMGGMMTYHAATHIADRIAAFAPVSGYLIGGPNTNSSRPIPIIHTHGTADNVVSYSGVQGTMNAWVSRNGCPTTPQVTQPYPPGKPNSNGTKTSWGPCTDGVEIVLLTLNGVGHWHSNDANGVHTSEEIWNFCKNYSLDGSGGGGCTGVTSLPNGTYTITARHSGKCFEVAGLSTSDGGNIQQWACSGDNNQQWIVTQSNGRYTFRSAHSDKCLDVSGGGTADGTNIQQWTCIGNDAQSFCLQDAGDGYYYIANYGSGKYVDVSGISTADGANIHQWTYHGGDNQQFRFTPVGGPSGGTFNGVYSFVAQHSGKAIDTYNFGTTNGTNIVQWSYWGGDAQRYQVSHLGDGWHRISPVIATGQALDVSGVSVTNGANIQTWAWSGGNNQQWRFEDAGNGHWKIIARHSNKCLDIQEQSTADGANVYQWDCITGAQNQAFQVIQAQSAGIASVPSGDVGVEIFPNPSSNGDFSVNILSGAGEGYRLYIFNTDGTKVYETNTLNSGIHKISTGLKKGVYFIRTGHNTNFDFKLIIL